MKRVLVVGLVAACHDAATALPDAAPTDAPGATNLVIPWSTTPVIPGDATTEVTIESALFRIDSLRVIGDAGTAAKTSFTVEWSAGVTPEAVELGGAPSGVYSTVTVRADGHLLGDSYDLTGTAHVAGVAHPFRIHDRDWITATVAISTSLEPGAQQHVPLTIHLDQALATLDWGMLYDDNGTLDLNTYDYQMPAFRQKLVAAFAVGQASATRSSNAE